MPHEALTLAGQSFYVSGPVRVNSVAEWTQGLKVGRATYDERLHAFWLCLDDFSAGIGHRRLEIREELGTCWDNTGGIDIRRARHITLPPTVDAAAITAPAAVDYTGRSPGRPITGTTTGGTALLAGLGGSIYRSTDNATGFTKVKDIASATMISTILEYSPPTPAAATALYAFCEGGGGTARYQRSTDAVTWADGGSGTQKVIEDAIVWREMLIGTRPISEIIFSVDGQTWNIDVAADAHPIWRAGYGRVIFVGAFMAPWGEGVVHFLATNQEGIISLFALDFDPRQAYEIPLGIGSSILYAIIHQNYIALTDGFQIYLWDGQTVRNISWGRKWAVPPCLQYGCVAKLCSVGDYLYALYETTDGAQQLMCYNGAGWTTLGPKVAAIKAPAFGSAARWNPLQYTTGRRLVALGTTSYSGVTSPKRVLWTLPTLAEVPSVGVDNFQDGPLYFTTGWIDGGFQELKGALYRLYCDGYNITASETVKVEYQLDNAEAAAWVNLGTFTAAGTYLSFAGSTGLEFRTVRFRITLDRGGTANLSPELMSLVLLYDKKPTFRSTWVWQVDVSQMVAEKVHVGGVDATLKNIWEALIAIWNTKPLVLFVVPNVTDGVYVKIADLPMTLDDFRDAVKGNGTVDLTLIEPVT